MSRFKSRKQQFKHGGKLTAEERRELETPATAWQSQSFSFGTVEYEYDRNGYTGNVRTGGRNHAKHRAA